MLKNNKEDLRIHSTGPIPILALLSVIALFGILLTWILRYFFV